MTLCYTIGTCTRASVDGEEVCRLPHYNVGKKDSFFSVKTPAITGNADQIERVEITVKVDDPERVELLHEQHSPVHRFVRSALWIARVALCQSRLAKTA